MEQNTSVDQQTKPKKPTPLLPQSYSWGRMIVISLGILGLGLSIAFGGFYLEQKNQKTHSPKTVTTPLPSKTTQPDMKTH